MPTTLTIKLDHDLTAAEQRTIESERTLPDVLAAVELVTLTRILALAIPDEGDNESDIE